MLQSLIRELTSGEGSMLNIVMILIASAMLIFAALPLHEFAHAFASHKLGDNTAKYNGRLTLNPLKHLDVFGTIMLLVCGVGYAKPVPVNPYNFRNAKRGMALSSLAGPMMNLILAIVSVGLYRVFSLITEAQYASALSSMDVDAAIRILEIDGYVFYVLIGLFASINLSLAVFNLLPIPPLDGSRIFAAFLPDKWNDMMYRYESYVMIGMMALLLSGALDQPLTWIRHGFGFVVCGMFGMPNVF